MADPLELDVLVIGSGPGGYVAAIRAAQLGLQVGCVERESLGGICLNWGCIPTKALLKSAEVLELFHRAAEFGLQVDNVRADFGAIIQRSRDVAAKISKGVAFLLKKNAITHLAGTAKLLPRPNAWRPHEVEVTSAAGVQLVRAKHVILATGARARALPGLDLDGDRIIEYRKAMTLPTQPRSLIVLGAGAIGVEFASFYRALGVAVTIVEFAPRIVPNEDVDISTELARAFDKRGITLLTSHKLTRAVNQGDKVAVVVEPATGSGAPTELFADVLLCAVGIQANTEDLGLEHHGIKLERGFIAVDAQLRAAEGIWAIGDVIGRGLAHTASAEGVYVAEQLAGKPEHPAVPVDYTAIPACTYCHPEVASVGLTEAKAREAGIPIKVGKFPFKPLGKTLAASEYPGLVKTIWHAETGALVGAHLIGPAVTDLIAELTLAKTCEVNADSLVYTVHAHPTFAEAIKESTEHALGHAIHL